MYLKQLTVRGFKSFASATTFDFEPGVTAVVGPNGSGKSNVVDALAWVMGEQGAKNLRGGKMDDVIFAGTSSRPALGRAHVTLTIDNSDGALPIEYTEVTISRTLFRNGGSEYSINDRPCRLLDIQELLSDSGLGREMHVIVGQGQLDRVLHATAEERRGLIEEAAGVLKHRRRRERAFRKLQSTDANLARLADLTSEVARALKPLERQARVARRARDIQFDLKDAQARLAAAALAAARAQESETRGLVDRLSEDSARLEREIQEQESSSPGIQQTFLETQARASSAQADLSALRRTLDRLGVVAELAQTRAASMSEAPSASQPDGELQRLETQLREAQIDEADAERRFSSLTERDAEAAERVRATERARRDAEAVVAQRQREQAQAREELLRVRGAAEAVGGRVQAARSELERAQALAEDAAQAETQAHRDLADLTAPESTSPADSDSPDVTAQSGRTPSNPGLELAAAVARRKKAEERLAAARGEARIADAGLSRLLARIDTLEKTLAGMSQDGLSGDELPAGSPVFADGLETDPEWSAPIGALLAHSAVLRVSAPGETRADALWDMPLGQIESPAPPQPPVASLDSLDLPAGSEAAVTLASHRLFPETLRELLADAVVADSAETARALLRRHPALGRVATPDGLVHTRAGQSSPLKASMNAVDLGSQIAEARRETAEAEDRAASTARMVDDAEAAASQAREAEQRLRAEQAKQATQRAVRDAALASARRTADQARQRSEKLHAAAEQSAARLAELLASHEEAQRRVELLEAVNTDSAEGPGLEDLRDGAESARRLHEDAQAAKTETALAARSAEERHRALSSRVRELQSSLKRAAESAVAHARAERRRRLLVARAERAGELIATALELASTERERAQRAHDSAQREFAAAHRAQQDHLRLGREIREALQKAMAELSTARAHLEHQQARRLELETGSVEQLGLSPDELIKEYGPSVPLPDGGAFDRAEQEKRLKRAQSEMQALGKVNPLALEEFAALEQRHAFLAGQLADLRGSRGDLLKIIKDVDETIERVFAEAYEDTAREFVAVFERLFPGGEGSLELTEPDDLLSSGLEVSARPAGKKVKRLSLLSGGERSLTAIALLVAIFKARPSPFYVMDEVEAALDDANLGRLIGLFGELRDSSQLIIVTHQKRTMEIADALYGVSMRGDGVSLVISQKMVRQTGKAVADSPE